MTILDITETVSEKPKRGRPREYTAKERAFMRDLYPERTHRTFKNHQARSRAMSVLDLLRSDNSYRWLCDFDSWKRGDGGVRFTLLMELGRIENEDDMHEFAAVLCEQQPKAKVAIAAIRRWRLGQSNEPDADTLFGKLMKTIDAYVEDYPDTSPRTVLTALGTCARTVGVDISA